MANDDPVSTPPAPPAEAATEERRPEGAEPRNGQRGGGHRRNRGPRGDSHPRKPRLPQRDVAEDEPLETEADPAAPPGEGPPEGEDNRSRLDLAVLKELSIQKLIEVAKALEFPGAT